MRKKISNLDKIPANRKKDIQEYVLHKGTCSINALSKKFKVSEITIRRDIAELEIHGKIKSIHGGVMPVVTAKEIIFDKKQEINLWQKSIIAKTILSIVENDTTIFMNSGTTTKECARVLLQKKHNLRIITNNYDIPLLLPRETDNKVVLLGGEYNPRSHSMIGTPLLLQLENMYAPYCILGTSGISLKEGLTTASLHNVTADNKLIQQTKGTVIVVADISKIETVSSFKVCDIGTIDVVITHQDAPKHFVQQLKKKNIRVILTT